MGLQIHKDAEPIPGHRLVRRIGRGGFGEVWEAEAPGGIGLRGALKFVACGHGAGAKELRSLEIFRAIRHPNLLVPFSVWCVGEVLVIGMELADGTLWDR